MLTGRQPDGPYDHAVTDAITFTVHGIPQSQGSKRLVGVTAGNPRMIEDNPKLAAWRTNVSQAALAARPKGRWRLWDEPVELEVRFVFPRPKRPKCTAAPCVKPDGDKLLRAIGDALTGIIIADDAVITDWVARKRYGPPGPSRGAGLAIVRVGPTVISWP